MKTIITIISALLFVSSIAIAQNTVTTYKAALDSFTCGNTFTDSRDSNTYRTVLIGTQCWMAQNLNYSDSGFLTLLGTGQSAAGTQKYCYENSESYCNIYGGLYEWKEMMKGAAACNGTGASQPECTNPVQGICPSGWHVPSHYEWTLLERNVGSNPDAFTYDTIPDGYRTYIGKDEGGNLKDTGYTHWKFPNRGATDSSGFTALGAGTSYEGAFANLLEFADWWTSTEGNYPSAQYTAAWNHHLDFDSAKVFRYFHDKKHGFSVRCVYDNLFTTGIEVKENETTIPDYVLGQNYPNPFNPSTVISWQSSRKLSGSYVTLKVFNVLGKEVAVLVNEKKEPGYYDIKFDASTLSSGIYFYQLMADNFIQVKKMLLLK